MDCGQVFGWDRDAGTYTGVIGERAVRLWQDDGMVCFVAEQGLKARHIRRYLGLDEDLGKILASIVRDAFMEKVVAQVRGLRLLKQEPWACLCSYILSANNRVERIDSLVKEVSRKFGKRHVVRGRVVYSLPGPGIFSECTESGMRSCGVGFRAPYLVRSAAMVAGGEVDLNAVGAMSYEDARGLLMTLPGVGGKIADCVLLFAFSMYDAFPVDVWIRRIMQQVYFASRETKPDDIRTFGREYFGEYAGYAQEYIYYYARHHTKP